MLNRVHNFSAGPAKLPDVVVSRLQQEAFDFKNKGFSIFEISHRSNYFLDVLAEVKQKVRKVGQLPADYHIIFLQGGAAWQYYMVPLNFMTNGHAAYIDTGVWSMRAIKDAQLLGKAQVVASSADKNYSYIPTFSADNLGPSYDYLHITTNNTIYGTQFKSLPKSNIPLIADMTSDIFSKKMDFSKVNFSYASLQKNLGISGLAIGLLDDALLKKASAVTPKLMSYQDYVNQDSLINTPNTLAIYLVGLMCDWILEQGGLENIEKLNQQKAALLYNTIDNSGGFYTALADIEHRSIMNVVFTTKQEALDKEFIKQAAEHKLLFLAGHRHIQGLRASIYNGSSWQSVQTLAEFMAYFQQKMG